MMLGITSDLLRYGRPGADEGHLATQNVDQLRQLIQARSPEPATNASDPWIVLDLEKLAIAVLVEVLKVGLQTLRLGYHRPELVDPENTTTHTHPPLSEEHFTGRAELDRHGHGGEERRQHEQSQKRDGEVERSLQRQLRQTETWTLHHEHEEPAQILRVNRIGDLVQYGGHEDYLTAGFEAPVEETFGHSIRRVSGHDNHLDVSALKELRQTVGGGAQP